MNAQFSQEQLELFRISIHCQVISRAIIDSPYESLKFCFSIFNRYSIFVVIAKEIRQPKTGVNLHTTPVLGLCVVVYGRFFLPFLGFED